MEDWYPCSFLVNRRWIRSISSISRMEVGDKITESCSTTGLTFVLYARTSKCTSPETKLRWIAKARLWALATMSTTWADGDRLLLTITPRSQTEGTIGSIQCYVNLNLEKVWHFNTQHLSIDIVSCMPHTGPVLYIELVVVCLRLHHLLFANTT